jgi:hypothetical protein
MIQKVATTRGRLQSEFLDLNHTSNSMIQVSLLMLKCAREGGGWWWQTSESGH